MGKPAARAIVDTAAHTGSITSGSFNVLIGGKPAARKGDPIICSSHGICSIIEGSSSVYINGIPAARMGDKTSCGTPPAPIPVGPKPAEKEYHILSIANEDKLNDDGAFKHKYDDKLKIKALQMNANYEDKTGDGSYDYINFGISTVDINTNFEDYGPFGKGNMGIGINGGLSKYKAEAGIGLYGSNGLYGAEAEGKASMTSGNVETQIGKEGILYEKGKITGDIAYAEAKAEAKLLTGGDEKKIGFQVEASADAGAAKADFEGQNDFFGIIKTKAKIGLSGGSGAIGGKAGAYLDYDDYEIGVNVGGKIAALLGIEGDVEISISAKPIVEAFKNIKEYLSPSIVGGTIITGDSTIKEYFSPSIVGGTIITGDSTVIIG